MKYQLVNTMNDRVLSQHKTLAAAMKAARAAQPKDRGSYLPTTILNADGTPLDEDALVALDCLVNS